LGNGFTYYIKNSGDDSKKLNMRLYIKTGSNNQEDDELDFAHAIEHLAFKCAKNFPVNLLNNSELWARLGMTKKDVFGQTSGTYTWYSFDVPANRMDAMDTGLLWFRDITNLDLTPTAINQERGPLRQELIYRNGDNLKHFFIRNQMVSKLIPCSQDYYNFFLHNRNFTPSALKEFYDNWYHPSRMAVVIVGNVTDLDAVEKRVKNGFSDIIKKEPSKLSNDCKLEYLERPNSFIALERTADKDNQEGLVEIHLYLKDKQAIPMEKEVNYWQYNVARDILYKLINDRFAVTGQDYNSSFAAHGLPPSLFLPAHIIQATTITGKEKEAIVKIINTLKQIKKHGITRNEWNRLKEEHIGSLRKTNTTKSSYWIEQFENNFVYSTPLALDILPESINWLYNVSHIEFNNLIDKLLSDQINDIGIIAPSGVSYTESEVRKWIDFAFKKKTFPYGPPDSPKQLLTVDERSSLKESEYNNYDAIITIPVFTNARIIGKAKPNGIIEFILQNGLRVVLDTVGVNNSTYIHGFTAAGASLFPEKDYFSAINAPSIIENAGVGVLNKFALNRFLLETSFWQGLEPYINYDETGIKIRGNASVEDIEYILQLVYLYFTQPRKDTLAFEDWKFNENKKHSHPTTYTLIQEDFNVHLRDLLGDNSIAPMGTKRLYGINETQMEKAYSIYNKLFGDASNFTFIISGDFSKDKILPLLQKYLGNLPSSSNVFSNVTTKATIEKELPSVSTFYYFTPKDIGANYHMESVRYALIYMSKVQKPLDWKERIKMEVLGILMASKIKELRYSKNASLYNMKALTTFNRYFDTYDFQMLLDCIPEELGILQEACKQMVSEARQQSFGTDRFDEVINNLLQEKYSLNQKNTYKEMYEYYRYAENWGNLLDINNYLKSLTQNDIRAAAKKYLNEENTIEAVMGNSK
jgi:predicted Zn-dependent peptidase